MAPAERTDRDSTSKRLGLLEQGQARLEVDFEGLRDDLRGLAASFETFSRDVREAITRRDRPQWGVMASVAAVLIGIAAAFFTPYAGKLDSLADRYETHLTQPAHPAMQARIGSLEAQIPGLRNSFEDQIHDLDVRTQREMRDLDEITRADLRAQLWKLRAEKLGWSAGG